MPRKPRDLAQRMKSAMDDAAKQEWKKICDEDLEHAKFRGIVWSHIKTAYARSKSA